MAKADSLKTYRSKRNFDITSEPAEGGDANEAALSFVIQKHWASRLHYDFRLELDGAMKSWAVPKGPSFDTHDKRMAVHVEDHPISYNKFEGEIPAKQYGAGKVIIWDRGVWKPIGDPRKGYAAGNLKFELFGHKLQGKWALIKIKNARDKQEAWLLIKEKDQFARPSAEFSVVDELPDSVTALGDPPTLPGPLEPIEQDHIAAESEPAPSGPPAAAKKAALPAKFSPELATLVDGPPHDVEDWLFEIKFDGYRILTRVENNQVQLYTRNGNDWTNKLPGLEKEILSMRLPDGWYDGEIVVLNEKGQPSFGALQQSFDNKATQNIIYYLFDVIYCSDYDLREVPLFERRQLLETILRRSPSDLVSFSASFDQPPQQMLEAACQMGLEGVIGKRRKSTYVSRRSPDWIKLKCTQRQEFVIGGYTDPQGSRLGIGSLLLGVHDENGLLRYAGNVGTGFGDKFLTELRKKLDAIASDNNPFQPDKDLDRKSHWVKPQLVAEVSFGEWTSSGHIRHSSFQGLRADKPASSIVRELPKHLQAEDTEETAHARERTKTKRQSGVASKKAAEEISAVEGVPHGTLPASLKVTHPERIIDKESGTTKLQLIRYYGLVAPLIMEHLKKRPLALVRAPEGVGGELFFQKHAQTRRLPGVNQLDPSLFPGHPGLLVG